MISGISSNTVALRPLVLECPADAVHTTSLPGPGEAPLVCLVRVNTSLPDLPGLAACLSPDEHRRAGRLRREQERHQFLIGRGWLRILLGRFLRLPADRIPLGSGRYGKPCVCAPHNGEPLQFNLAHSGDVILLAFHQYYELGVDVEEIADSHEWTAVARQMFTPEQIRNWSHLTPAQWTEAFFVAWTRREAELKAIGTGFAAEEVVSTDASLRLFDLELPLGYAGAVAVRPMPEKVFSVATNAKKNPLVHC